MALLKFQNCQGNGSEFSIDVEDLMKGFLMQQSNLGVDTRASVRDFLKSFLTQMGRSGEGLNCITLFVVFNFMYTTCLET